LLLLAVWTRRIEGRQENRVVDEIRDADHRGANRPVGQYPHIDPYLCIGCGSCVKACPENGVIGLVDGIAHVIRAAQCIGHARCEDVCPVGALHVGLGDVTTRSDIPQLSEDLQTTVPGVFIAGELGGLALIRHAIDQGVQAVDAVARSARRHPSGPDVLITGSGPAGIAASLRAIELGLSYQTIDMDDIGGTIRKYPRRKLVMTQPVELPLVGKLKQTEYLKEELVDLLDDIITQHDVQVRTGVKLLGVERCNGTIDAVTSTGVIPCGSLVLALGRRGTPRRLGVPGEELEKVLYQLIDTSTYTNTRALVVGGGDSAVEAAMALASQPGNEVTLSYRKGAFFRLKRRNEERIEEFVDRGRVRLVFNSNVVSIEPDAAIISQAGRSFRLRNDYVFVFAGGEPPFPLLKQIGVGFWGEE
jgi:thioredoxin reductase/NAD-dependent dihydropyrimidine dehydrogenase PreA subunit